MEKEPEFEDETAANAAYKISDYADRFIYGKYLERGTLITKNSVTSANILAAFAEAQKAMLLANVPDSVKKRFEMSPDVYIKLVLARVLKETSNTKILDTGYVGTQFGFDLFVSNNIVTTGTDVGSTSHCIVRTKRAIAYAEQINDTEKLRHPKRFGDIHRGLYLGGAKVVVPKELICVDITTAAES
jgi:hypothetical protein